MTHQETPRRESPNCFRRWWHHWLVYSRQHLMQIEERGEHYIAVCVDCGYEAVYCTKAEVRRHLGWKP